MRKLLRHSASQEAAVVDLHADRCTNLDLTIWMTIALIACGVITSSFFTSFVVDWLSFLKPAVACILMLLGAAFYRLIRKDLPLTNALGGAAQVVAFASVAAPLSYLAASADYPLRDVQFAAWDHELGLNWMAWLAFMNASPRLHLLTSLAYGSFALQTTAVVITLGLAKQALRLRLFVMAFIATTLIVIAISAAFPAQGVWGFWHLSLADSPIITPAVRDLPLPVFFGLRDGTYRHLVAENAVGLISFPSLHAALGLLFTFALWRVNGVRWFALAINLLLIAATPVEGSHYFSDVIAGLVIATASWLAVGHVLTRSGSSSDQSVREAAFSLN